ncbi:unnamed protein product [Owenia fusiformis]|uniref:Uncharacterized protein n=1 Tax=Owenia fusiformis TaxID=6347 RepID=A0A8J1XTK9_OWEFU|nr:unnamed protein product [Owenia fusiformis]
MTDYEAFFKEADTDNSGFLTLSELKGCLVKRGYKGTSGELENLFNKADQSGDDKMSFEEYMVVMGAASPEQHKAARMREVFNGFDKDGSGEVDKAEMDQVFKEMGKHLSEAEIARMIQLADTDGSGTLNISELIKHCFGVDM